MAEWWKTLSEAFRKVEHPGRALSLKDRLSQEQVRLKEEDARWRRGNGDAPEPRTPGETEAMARQEDARALEALLRWKMDVNLVDLNENPVNIDGYWFGVQRYVGPPVYEDGPYEMLWKLHLFRPCPHCKLLIPTIELGDYAEALAATRQIASGQEAFVPKSTQKLASYLNEIEGGRFDPHLPRVCPKCHNLLKGMKM